MDKEPPSVGAVLSTDISEIFKNLNNSIPDSRAKMLERNFVLVFLPFFAGEENKYEVTLTHWSNYAGGPFWEVDVVDNKGVTLFTVPPVLSRDNLKPLTQTEGMPSMTHVVHTVGQLTNRHPIEGRNYLEQQLTRRDFSMRTSNNVIESLHIWNEIFKRYGRAPIVQMDKPALTAQKNNGKLQDDEFDYE